MKVYLLMNIHEADYKNKYRFPKVFQALSASIALRISCFHHHNPIYSIPSAPFEADIIKSVFFYPIHLAV